MQLSASQVHPAREPKIAIRVDLLKELEPAIRLELMTC
jgi:hypothetical protein